MAKPFLTARWEHLVMANHAVSPALLEPLVPRGTELDYWQGEALVSLVGFMFEDTRVLGVGVPGHRDFEEVNLRFYVRRRADDGTARRAVVFIRELVPRRALAAVARWIYNEPYLAVPMGHSIAIQPDRGGTVAYSWRFRAHRYRLAATVEGLPLPPAAGSEAEFITEHYWGYTRQRDGGTLEYEVKHPPWRVWTASALAFEGPAAELYGEDFAACLSATPRSAFVAEGSAITVGVGARIA